jgi:hypothetical protein
MGIIDEVKAGSTPTHEELRYALLACNALLTFARLDVMHLCIPRENDTPKMVAQKNRVWDTHCAIEKAALAADAKVWYKKNGDPFSVVE